MVHKPHPSSQADLGRLVPSLTALSAAALDLHATVGEAAHAWELFAATVRGDGRRHRRRCRRCNPAGNPPPVAGWYQPGPKAARMGRQVHGR